VARVSRANPGALNRKAAEEFPGGFSFIDFFSTTQHLNLFLSHPKGIERRLIDHGRSGEPSIGLVASQRLPGQRPE
jgi:hypothetical protein